MSQVRLRPRAKADLREIWVYSVERWGVGKANAYIEGVYAAATRLSSDLRSSRACDDIRPGYRKHRVGSHVIYFKTTEDAIDVVRILHERMEPGLHL